MVGQRRHTQWRFGLLIGVLLLIYFTQWKLISQQRILSTTNAASCALHTTGDANCDGTIDISDFEIFRKEYTQQLSTLDADFDGDFLVTVVDFEVWRRGYFNPIISTISTPTASAPSVTATSTPVISVVPGSTGIWISGPELMQHPMSGAAWDAMKKVADGDVGVPNMSDQDSPNPERTLAVALVGARTGLDSYRQKAIVSLTGVIGTEKNPDPNCAVPTLGARGLAVGRNLIAYVVAADVLNFRTGGYDPEGKATRFQQWVESIRHRKNCDNNGAAAVSGDISAGHDGGCSNGDALAGASRIAAAAYLKDKTELDKAWFTFQRYAGNSTVGPVLRNNSYSQTWLYDMNAHVCINPKGSQKNGFRIDGVLPNDQGRGGPFQVPPAYTQYPWEGLQGIYAQAVMLDRLGYKDAAGKTPWHVSDDALFRAVDFQAFLQQQYGGAWFDTHRAAWVKHLANIIYGKSYPVDPSGGGRNMDYTQWTH